MKTTDFISEDFVTDATLAHQDHEVQMARADCYNAAKTAIELHRLLKNISEQQGLDGWVSEKITLANDYLKSVTEYLRYEQMGSPSIVPEFDAGAATQSLDAALGEGGVGTVRFPDDEGTHTSNQPIVRLGGTFDKRPQVKQGSLVKASGLNGVWRVNDIRRDEADITQEIPNTGKSMYIPLSDLRVWTNKPIKEQDVAEDKLNEFATGGGTGSASIATTPGVGAGKKVGSLFGGSYQSRSPFTKKKKK